jgi:hypothetical protein
MQTGLSNLIFNQACAGSNPAIPITFRVGCSSTAERRTVNAKTTSSTLASRPNFQSKRRITMTQQRKDAQEVNRMTN